MTKSTFPTQREVAREAGVSDMTVSRVLRGKGVVSEETREHVLRVVHRLGYVQNRLAGSLSDSRSNQVGLIIPSVVNNLFTQVVAGVADELEKAGYNPVVGISDYDIKREERLVESMMSWRPAGFIVTDFVHTDRTRAILKAAKIPVVEILETVGKPIDMCVGFDHANAARALADYLLEKGYRRFGYLGWNNTVFAAAKRYAAFKEHLAENGLGLRAPDYFDCTPDLPSGKQALDSLLGEHPDLDAVVFSNDMAASGGIIRCMEKGIKVPEQLAIAGFGGLQFGQSMPASLTTIFSKRGEIGRRAARLVLNALAGRKPEKTVDLGFDLIVGASA